LLEILRNEYINCNGSELVNGKQLSKHMVLETINHHTYDCFMMKRFIDPVSAATVNLWKIIRVELQGCNVPFNFTTSGQLSSP